MSTLIKSNEQHKNGSKQSRTRVFNEIREANKKRDQEVDCSNSKKREYYKLGKALFLGSV
jgi:hypothetical protein